MHFYRGSGVGAAWYFDEAHRGVDAYYGEEGRVVVGVDSWSGGERVGGTVVLGRGDLVRWVEGVDLVSGEAKGVIRSGGEGRGVLRFVEVVVNNPKSLSVVACQDPVVADVLDGVLARQADEVCRYLSRVAVCRVGGRGAQVEVGGLVIETARVTHLTSREGDPHRHVHLMLNARVRTGEGEWRGLHSVAVRQHIRAVNALAGRVLVTDRQLREVLAGRGYTLGVDGEVDQARAVVGLFSKRSERTALSRERFEVAWREAHPGREPSRRVRNGWDHQAWREDRPVKAAVRETPEQLAGRVRAELAAAGFDFTPGARRAVRLEEQGVPVGGVDRDRLAGDAVAVLSAQKSAWSAADLAAAVEEVVARSGVVDNPDSVGELVEDVRGRALGGCVSVLDPELHVPTVMSRYLTSQAVVDADMRLNLGFANLASYHNNQNSINSSIEKGVQDGVEDGGVEDGVQDGVEDGGVGVDGRGLDRERGLDVGQVAAVGVLCGTGRLGVIVGPAGSGKTRVLSVARERLEDQGRGLVVVAPTRKGAQVAAAEVGAGGASLSKLLYDYGWRWDQLGRWSRLAVGDVDSVTGRPHEPPGGGPGGVVGGGLVLSAGTVLVVDEAGLMSVEQANALVDVVAETGASLRLVGDPRQLGAVGRGGVMETAWRWLPGGPVTLDEIHRFVTVSVDGAGMPAVEVDTAYAGLSRRLRDGADPAGVAEALAARGAVVVHPSHAQAVDAIAAQVASCAGREGALAVTVATNSDARRINRAVRDLRVAAGVVDDSRVAAGVGGERVGVGDRIVTRRNSTAIGVANREAWTVEAVSVGVPLVLLSFGYAASAGSLYE